MTLTDEQRKLVTENIGLIYGAIKKYNIPDKLPYDYDDLVQIASVAICNAAATYNGTTAFSTYAYTVIRNAFFSEIEKQIVRFRHSAPVYEDCIDLLKSDCELCTPGDCYQEKEIITILTDTKKRYTGITAKGVEVLILKIKGFSGTEIAQMYGVKPNLVGAWLSRAASKLRKDKEFLNIFLA